MSGEGALGANAFRETSDGYNSRVGSWCGAANRWCRYIDRLHWRRAETRAWEQSMRRFLLRAEILSLSSRLDEIAAVVSPGVASSLCSATATLLAPGAMLRFSKLL